ncbi:OmpA family protein [Massilia aquatica]|uniref:OmpA family protein n=1 Tax=Massilia aquatica TaxID=2609000 RepID=UPI001421C709|nr:OmpA family protein [Massilia aquatica]
MPYITALFASAGCSLVPSYTTTEEKAIDLCGSIGTLQAANTRILSNVDSLMVKGNAEASVTYPDLTPQLRVSAMRSTAHCINLQTGKITAERYDSLMAAEAEAAARAEAALTAEQLDAMMNRGYKTIADILRKAGVSENTVQTVAQRAGSGERAPPVDSDDETGQPWAAMNAKMGTLETVVRQLPGVLYDKLRAVPPLPAQSATTPLTTIYFPSGRATLSASALLDLHRQFADLPSDTRLSVVGSADAKGDPLRNMELSRQRAQSVAVWLINNARLESHAIHIGARGAGVGADHELNRSVTIFSHRAGTSGAMVAPRE